MLGLRGFWGCGFWLQIQTLVEITGDSEMAGTTGKASTTNFQISVELPSGLDFRG